MFIAFFSEIAVSASVLLASKGSGWCEWQSWVPAKAEDGQLGIEQGCFLNMAIPYTIRALETRFVYFLYSLEYYFPKGIK